MLSTIQVHYYERLEDSLTNGRSSTLSSHGSSTGARSESPPPQTPPTSQLSANNLKSLDEEIVAILKGRENGVYAKRLGKEYESFFKKPPPADILECAKKLPFVQAEE